MGDDDHERLFDGLGEEPSCPSCGTVMHAVDGAYLCRWCGETIEIPWVERPAGGDELPGLFGG